MLKKIICLFFLLFITSTSLYGGWKWSVAKSVTKGALVVGAKKAYDVAKTKKILKPTRHSINQKINRNVTTQSEIDALKRPLNVKQIKKDSLDRPSQRYIGEKAEVAVNPLLGKIVSVNPTSKKKALKLSRIKNEKIK